MAIHPLPVNSSTATHRIFITGATGYVGVRLASLLIRQGHHVTALVRQASVKRAPTGCSIVVGDAVDGRTFVEQLQGIDTFVQLVGAPKPAPWKGEQFRAIDGPSALAAIHAARVAGIEHFVYVSVAHPAPIMKDYIAVRTECEAAIVKAGLIATILRPWYILGPGHRWPLALLPVYRLLERLPGTHEAATRLGLVTIREMLSALLWSIEHPPTASRVLEVSKIRSLGKDAADSRLVHPE